LRRQPRTTAAMHGRARRKNISRRRSCLMAGQKGSLKMVARLNAEAERQAGEALRSAQERLTEEETQLETVRSLLEDYESRSAFAGGQLMQLRDARDFVAQLQAGLQAQIITVESQRRLTEAARAQWVS